MENFITESIFDIYKVAAINSADETTIPDKSRNNPHHMHIPLKPHPNCMMLISPADSNEVVHAIKLRCRIGRKLERVSITEEE